MTFKLSLHKRRSYKYSGTLEHKMYLMLVIEFSTVLEAIRHYLDIIKHINFKH